MKRFKRKSVLRILLGILLFNTFLGAAGLGALYFWGMSLIPELPEISSVQQLKLKVPLRIYSSDGLLMAEYGSERRVPVRIDEAPQQLIQAVLAAEDDKFYEHAGVDFIGFTRAAIENLKAGGITQGASTITMQVARNYFLSRERTYVRKAKEVLLAFQLERLLSKDEILELYLNKIFLGHRAYGFGAAARTYYGKPLSELTLAQYAMLAALPKSPSRVNPLSQPDNALQRRDYILGRMLSLDLITEEEHEAAIQTPLTAASHVAEVELKAPYVAEYVRQKAVDLYGELAYEDGYKIFTTVHSKNQKAAEQSLRKGLYDYDERHGFRGPVRTWKLEDLNSREDQLKALQQLQSSEELIPVLITSVSEQGARGLGKGGEEVEIAWEQMKWARRYKGQNKRGPKLKHPGDAVKPGDMVYAKPADDGWRLSQIPEVEGALVAIRPRDGAIQAMVGGFDYFLGKFNRSTQAVRQLGSNIKPFIYSAAFEQGYTPASVVSAAPVVIEDENTNVVWRPENYSGKFYGPTRLRNALSRSLNLVSVRLMRSIGWEYVAEYLAGFGFEKGELPQGLSLALGSAAFTPLEVASGYAVFANGGYSVQPYIIDVVKDRYGKAIWTGRKALVCDTCLIEAEPAGGVDEAVSEFGEKPIASRVISPGNAYLMKAVLGEVVNSGTARSAKSLKRSDLAGKTGTTNNFEDAWFSGFNPDMAATVWVGFDQPSNLGQNESGAKAALPIWIDFMRTALEDLPESSSTPPDNIVTVTVDKETGKAVEDEHPNGIQEFFIAGTQPMLENPSLAPGISIGEVGQQNAEELF